MDNAEIQAIREEARKVFNRLNTPGTTIYAVTHVRDLPEDAGPIKSNGNVIDRFQAILPRQQQAFEAAVKMFGEEL